MSPNEMLAALSNIWKTVVEKYPDADHKKILEHVEALQSLLFYIK